MKLRNGYTYPVLLLASMKTKHFIFIKFMIFCVLFALTELQRSVLVVFSMWSWSLVTCCDQIFPVLLRSTRHNESYQKCGFVFPEHDISVKQVE